MSTDPYAYRPGLIFLSKYAGYVISLWPERYHIYPDGSREMIAQPGAADFEFGLETSQEFVPEDEDGRPVTTSPVMGMADYYQWTEEQRDTAARKLLRVALDPRQPQVTLFEPKAPEPPWPTYDKLQNYLEIAKLADDLGLLVEAIAYERYTKRREGVLSALEARRRDREAEEALTAQ